MHRRFVAIAGLGLLAGGGLASAGLLGVGDSSRAPVSDVIYPQQSLPLRFDHAEHLAMKVDCDFCHEDAAESRSSIDDLIPTEESCASCHDIDRTIPDKAVPAGKPPARCDACHVGFVAGQAVARVRVPVPNLKFDHRAHVSRGVACTVCHGDLAAEKIGVATRDQLPKMRLCLTCHDGRKASSRCTTCHIADQGMVQTNFPEGQLVPSGSLRGDAHDLTFRSNHRDVADNDPDYCGSCHRKSECVECHNGVIKPMDFHAGDYVSQHALDARRNQPDCGTCHRLQTFCVGCHSRSGVTDDGRGSEFRAPSTGLPGRRFHPDGWLDTNGGVILQSRGPMHHSFQAQRNIRQCASCHREEFCKRCHTAEPGSLRINPHPAGWAGSRRCRALAARAGRMCLRCHTDVFEATCDR